MKNPEGTLSGLLTAMCRRRFLERFAPLGSGNRARLARAQRPQRAKARADIEAAQKNLKELEAAAQR
jgi:hypothetical protein